MNLRSPRGHGFTLLELMVVVTLTTLLMPLIYAFHRSWEEHSRRAVAQMEAAEATRRLSDNLRLDLRLHNLVEDSGVLLEGSPCESIRYHVRDEGFLVRDAVALCGGATVIARNVERLERDGDLLEITFSRRVRADLKQEIITRVGVVQ